MCKCADIALIEGVRSGVYIDRVLPDEDMVVQVEGVKMSGPTLPTINRHWGRLEAREDYHNQGTLHCDLFDEVDWDSTERHQRCFRSGLQSRFLASVAVII